ncbi:MAG TPA: cellulose binding domain-containing protein [Actinocrinis sp.]|nr:cellulose binding domain-containing protein [Actinocrinis sp.]
MTRRSIPWRALGAALAAALALSFGAPAAQADSPLPTPSGLQALHVSDTSADLDWTSSGLSDGDVVQRKVGGTWTQYASGAFGYLALTGLTPGTTYTFRVYSTILPGQGYTASAPSAPLSFATLSGPDTVPPAKPAAPTFSSITTTMANAFWPQTTDNVQVTGYYLQQLVGGVWTTVRTVTAGGNFQGLTGLAPSTSYTFGVIAFDARGNTSARSDPGTFTTLATTALPSCVVQNQNYNNVSFETTVTIVNTTAAALNPWSVRFTLPANATTSGGFNGVLTRSGSVATISPAVYDTSIGPGGTLYVGFGGSDSPFALPSGFTVNGAACSGA